MRAEAYVTQCQARVSAVRVLDCGYVLAYSPVQKCGDMLIRNIRGKIQDKRMCAHWCIVLLCLCRYVSVWERACVRMCVRADILFSTLAITSARTWFTNDLFSAVSVNNVVPTLCDVLILHVWCSGNFVWETYRQQWTKEKSYWILEKYTNHHETHGDHHDAL